MAVLLSYMHRYRTAMCRDGERCPRAVCFFAHNQAQLRKAGYPTTDYDGNPLSRPKYSLSALKTQQPPVATASAPTTAAVGYPVQQEARQTSSNGCNYSRHGSLDATFSAIDDGAFSEQHLLPCLNRAGFKHYSGTLNSSSRSSSGSYEAYPVLPTPLTQISGSAMPNTACFVSANAYSGSSSSSPIDSGFIYLPPSSAHVQYSNCTGNDVNGSGVSAPVGTVPDATALLPVVLERLNSTQQQAQIAQQAADAANGHLLAVYQALGVSPKTTSSGSSSSLCMPVCSAVANAQALSPAAYGFGNGSNIGVGSFGVGSFGDGQFACLPTPHNSERLVLLHDAGSVQGTMQQVRPLAAGSMQVASAAQAWLPQASTRAAAAVAATGSTVHMSATWHRILGATWVQLPLLLLTSEFYQHSSVCLPFRPMMLQSCSSRQGSGEMQHMLHK